VGKITPKFGQNPKTFGLISTSILVWGYFFKCSSFKNIWAATHKNEFLGRKNGRKLPYFKEMFFEIASF
jgi:hypothetical protein